MKKHALLNLILMFAIAAQAQFYVSTSGGYSISSAGINLGTETTISSIENNYGSYGEGLHAQLRAGYYFYDSNFGAELAIGYLLGADQTINKVTLPEQPFVDIIARGRAFGASLSLLYKFNDHIYGRFGGLIKIGGRTEALGSVTGIVIPAGNIPNVPIDTTLDLEFEQHYVGKLPFGFVGALGYKYEVTSNIALFAELEYMGISITRDEATMESFSAAIRENGTALTIDQVREILIVGENPLASLLYNKIDFVDELSLTETDPTKQLARTVPYSSFGLNFGVTFTFGNASSRKIDEENSYKASKSLD